MPLASSRWEKRGDEGSCWERSGEQGPYAAARLSCLREYGIPNLLDSWNINHFALDKGGHQLTRTGDGNYHGAGWYVHPILIAPVVSR